MNGVNIVGGLFRKILSRVFIQAIGKLMFQNVITGLYCSRIKNKWKRFRIKSYLSVLKMSCSIIFKRKIFNFSIICISICISISTKATCLSLGVCKMGFPHNLFFRHGGTDRNSTSCSALGSAMTSSL